MKINKVEVAMFAFVINQDVMFTEVISGGEKLKKLFKDKKPYIYQDQQTGASFFLYESVEERNKYFNIAIALGLDAVPVVNPAMVDSKYLKKDGQ